MADQDGCVQEEALKVFIQEQCRRLKLSLNSQIQAALPAAALYFIACQEAREQRSEMPKPPMLPETDISSTAFADEKTSFAATEVKSVNGWIQDSVCNMQVAPQTDQHPSAETSQEAENIPSPRGADAMDRALWEMNELQKGDMSQSWFELAIERKMNEKSMTLHAFELLGLKRFLPKQCPSNRIVPIADAPWFHHTSAAAIVLNVIFSLYVADESVRRLLHDPPQSLPDWWDTVDACFTVFFTVEISVRFAAFRLWFFVDPDNWKSNLFDLFLVLTSVITLTFSGLDLLFFRCLRLFRIVRMARVVRLVNAFTELRKLLFAVLACMTSLLWAVTFLAITFMLFSLIIMQGIKAEVTNHLDNDDVITALREHFMGMGRCFKTFLMVVGGPDWVPGHDALSDMGFIYATVMPIFVLFVNIGIMNIVIGVFAEAASRCTDRDLIARDVIGDLEDFITTMLSLHRECAPHGNEKIDWEVFKMCFHKEEVQAFLASYQLDISHLHLVYKLFDADGNDDMDIHEFVLGLLKFKGEDKGLDMKVVLHSVSALGEELRCMRKDVRQILHRDKKLANSQYGHLGTPPAADAKSICRPISSGPADAIAVQAEDLSELPLIEGLKVGL